MNKIILSLLLLLLILVLFPKLNKNYENYEESIKKNHVNNTKKKYIKKKQKIKLK